METEDWQIYLNVNETGNVVDAEYGEKIIPAIEYHYFFLRSEEVAANIFDYRVEIVGNIPTLVKKIPETIEEEISAE
ncbi:hypothetical protein [Planococcus wigleyi]|uniref:Uncharacterized protein n=1 Tax=Planococcus wigleyi TaxID=2762216 RepID=A0ABR8WA67_9BACL|nr:hypothetical protein [Planococcus wigleyi]MBD8013899.1 hypothetical protein [Planococcus wigleyi]